MKRLLTVLLAGISAVFASCGDDGAEKGDTWFLKPEAVVSGTTAEISCRTKFADGVLTESGAGFVYTRIGAADGYFDAEPVEVSGNALSCRLSDLEPETDYLVYAYLELGGAGRMQSESVSFRTGKGSDPGNAPAFGQPAYSEVTSSSAVVSCTFSYQGAEPVSEVYFLYGTGGVSKREAVSAQPGAKSVRLSGLDASTDYTFRLCVAAGGKTYESGEAAFTTDAGDGPGPGPNPGLTKFSGWPELPVEVKNGDYHYAYHTISDFKVGNYNARNYTVCYSAENHGPVWVAAPLHNCYVTTSGNRSYSQDPDVPAGIQPASKSLADPYNKGHMLGNRERSRTAVMRRQVCYYTNIAPQHSGTFNTGRRVEQPRRRDRQVLGRDQEFQCRRYALCGRRGLLQDVDRLVRQYGFAQEGRLRRSAGGRSDHVLLRHAADEERQVRQIGAALFARGAAVRGLCDEPCHAEGAQTLAQRYAQRRGSRAAERVPVLYQRAQCAQGYL